MIYKCQMNITTLVHSGLVHNGGGKRNGSIAIYLETGTQTFLISYF